MLVNRKAKIVLALASGLSEVYRLRSLVFAPAPGELMVTLPADTKQSTLHFLAFHSGIAVGCLSLVQQDLAAWEGVRIQMLAVDPDYQGDGVGSALLKQAVVDCNHRWPEKLLWLSSVDSAKAFYLKNGFLSFLDSPQDSACSETIFIKS